MVKQITNRESISLDKYLQEISKIEMLTPELEAQYASKARHGDQKALEKLINANLRFVVSVAKQYQNQGLSLMDLINEGNIGLIKAATRFDETRGFKFISYAVWWILQSILQALAENARIVRLPLNKIGSINKINRMFSSLEQEFEREPSIDELAQSLDLAPEDVRVAIGHSSRYVSMDAPLPDSDNGTNLYEILMDREASSPDKDLIHESLRREIERVLHSLTSREADILRLYYGLKGYPPHSLDEIGEKFHLTRERVRQIKERAIRRLKNVSRCKILRSYF
jgi:RNA polymerase primary sigma factor